LYNFKRERCKGIDISLYLHFLRKPNFLDGKLMPKTILGKWSLGLIIAMPLLFVIGMSFTDTLYESVPAGGTILRDIVSRPALALTMLAGMASGISAFITGLIAIIKQNDRAILVYAAMLVGAGFTLFLIGELVFPH
jgi:hypothetical protein